MKIIVDHREKNSLVSSELMGMGMEIEFRQLLIGDYVITDEIAVERKTIDDFVSSMINKRLIFQLSDLKKNFKKPLLLIEGTDEQDFYRPVSHPNMNENAIKGMMLSIVTDFGIPIIFSKDYKDSATFLYLLAKREENGPREFSFKIKRKTFNMKEQQQMIIEGFPGVGPSIAKNILSHFKTIPAFANASIEELEKVEKVGKKKAVNIRALLDKNY